MELIYMRVFSTGTVHLKVTLKLMTGLSLSAMLLNKNPVAKSQCRPKPALLPWDSVPQQIEFRFFPLI